MKRAERLHPFFRQAQHKTKRIQARAQLYTPHVTRCSLNNDRTKRNVKKMAKRRPWVDRLKNKTAFSQACSTLISDSGWLSDAKKGHLVRIDRKLQNEILQGFRKFYCKKQHKRQYIDTAGGITWKLCADGKNGCFILTDSNGIVLTTATGVEISVSKNCPPLNKEAEIKEACRGSIHFEQILQFKIGEDTEVDHCNRGGFEGIYREWRTSMPEFTTEQLYEYVVKNDVLNRATTKLGYRTFKPPILRRWKAFHFNHAKLQELPKHEHKHVTKQRRIE